MDRFNRLEEKINYRFHNKQLLHEALTHTSYANEHRATRTKHNERLEFLGDSVLNLVITTYLFKKLKNVSEGEMSRIRSTIVCEKSLRMSADTFGLNYFILLGKGEEQTGGRERDSIISDAMEALIGAIYLDSGLASAESFIMEYMMEIIRLGAQGLLFKDYKTQYQELVQKNTDEKIEYHVIEERGPDHKKVFTVELTVGGKAISTGTGRNKKEAEQSAAKEAIAIGNQKR